MEHWPNANEKGVVYGAFQDKSTKNFFKLTPSYFTKFWNLAYRVVWHAEDDWANIGALQAKVNEL